MAKNALDLIHPGAILLKDFMKLFGLSHYKMIAKGIRVSVLRISQIVCEVRVITADTAMRLGCYFGTIAGIWRRLQAQYDLEVADGAHGQEIEKMVPQLAAQR